MMNEDRLPQLLDAAGRTALGLIKADDRQVIEAVARSGREARAMALDLLPEAERLLLIKAQGVAPAVCGDAAPIAPARGPVRAVEMLAAYPAKDGKTELKPAGFAGRRTMQRCDVFDLMRAQAARRGGVFPFSPGQIGMARHYAALVEQQAAGGQRCISAEAMMTAGTRGGSPEGYTDARLDLGRRIDALRRRIGTGAALAVRRVRPSERDGGAKRALITDRALVDLVCLEGMDLSAVLSRHGWAVKGDAVKALSRALSAALDRMIG